MLRFLPKAVIFGNERGKMLLKSGRKHHPWDLVGTVTVFLLKLGCHFFCRVSTGAICQNGRIEL